MFSNSSKLPKTQSPGAWSTFRRGVVGALRDFCTETSFHGLNHIATPGRLHVERLLWVVVVSCAVWGAVDISRGQWQRYNESPTVVTVEKDFRSWHYPFPATTVCNRNKTNPSKLRQAVKSRWNVDPGHPNYTYYSSFVDTVANTDLFNTWQFQKYAEDHTLDVDLFQLAVDVMPEVSVKVTRSNGAASTWIPVMTESGICHVTNSRAIADIAVRKVNNNETKDYPITCKYSDDCYVIFEITSFNNFHTHSPYDVSDILSPPTSVYPSLKRRVTLSVLETRCGAGVDELPVRRRNCLYGYEGGERQVYSTNMCRRSCRNSIAVAKCGCKPYYYFYEGGPWASCNASGLACLSRHTSVLANPRCACAVHCIDALFQELAVENTFWSKGPFASMGDIRFTVQPPRTRYTREIVFHFQDLIVSFGGAAGLFLGASFLSFVEIFYFILERLLNKRCDVATHEEKLSVNVSKSGLSYEQSQIMRLNGILKNDGRL